MEFLFIIIYIIVVLIIIYVVGNSITKQNDKLDNIHCSLVIKQECYLTSVQLTKILKTKKLILSMGLYKGDVICLKEIVEDDDYVMLSTNKIVLVKILDYSPIKNKIEYTFDIIEIDKKENAL